MEATRQSELQFGNSYARPMPDFEKKAAAVKLNAAAIKREGHLLKIAKEKEEKVLKDFEQNCRDEKDFMRWQSEMKEKDEIEHLEHVQKMKIEMELARDAAIEATQNKLHENKKLVGKMKVESEKRLLDRDDQKRERHEMNKAKVAEVHEGADRAAQEVEKVK